jgi:2,3-bisphosphoglycerate-independent phosphoglycerate mutase
MAKRRVVLCILDGFGVAPGKRRALGHARSREDLVATDSGDFERDPIYHDGEAEAISYDTGGFRLKYGDATEVAEFFWELFRENPHTFLSASGAAVGLPDLQVGNSEVGHSTIGLGRVVKQDLCRINDAVSDGSFAEQPALKGFIALLKSNGGAAHILGLISAGGVHSHIDHIITATKVLSAAGINVYIHAILDGRDTPPRSAKTFLHQLNAELPRNARVVSVCGRFYAMDRDCRWERTKAAYLLITAQQGTCDVNSLDHLFSDGYYEYASDEFVEPTSVGPKYEESMNDALLVMNFRADRIRQIVRAIGEKDFDIFHRSSFPRFSKIIGLTEYGADLKFCDAIFPREEPNSSLGQVVAAAGLLQVRIAETEKYAHVTYFLNGGVEQIFAGEDRVLVPSPSDVAYDKCPEMSASKVTTKTIEAMRGDYDIIIVNYANADMIGHTGSLETTTMAIEILDECLKQLVAIATEKDVTLLITADHGNAEQMLEEDGSARTAHTTNAVPFVAFNLPDGLQFNDSNDGGLSDVAPSILCCLGLEVPSCMTGSSLFSWE